MSRTQNFGTEPYYFIKIYYFYFTILMVKLNPNRFITFIFKLKTIKYNLWSITFFT